MSGGQGIEQFLSARYRGNGGHACQPAGRGTKEPRWACFECKARWKRDNRTMTWERADLR